MRGKKCKQRVSSVTRLKSKVLHTLKTLEEDKIQESLKCTANDSPCKNLSADLQSTGTRGRGPENDGVTLTMIAQLAQERLRHQRKSKMKAQLVHDELTELLDMPRSHLNKKDAHISFRLAMELMERQSTQLSACIERDIAEIQALQSRLVDLRQQTRYLAADKQEAIQESREFQKMYLNYQVSALKLEAEKANLQEALHAKQENREEEFQINRDLRSRLSHHRCRPEAHLPTPSFSLDHTCHPSVDQEVFISTVDQSKGTKNCSSPRPDVTSQQQTSQAPSEQADIQKTGVFADIQKTGVFANSSQRPECSHLMNFRYKYGKNLCSFASDKKSCSNSAAGTSRLRKAAVGKIEPPAGYKPPIERQQAHSFPVRPSVVRLTPFSRTASDGGRITDPPRTAVGGGRATGDWLVLNEVRLRQYSNRPTETLPPLLITGLGTRKTSSPIPSIDSIINLAKYSLEQKGLSAVRHLRYGFK